MGVVRSIRIGLVGAASIAMLTTGLTAGASAGMTVGPGVADPGVALAAGSDPGYDPGSDLGEQIEDWQWLDSSRWLTPEHLHSTGPLAPMPELELLQQTTIVPGLEHSRFDNGLVEAEVLQADLTSSGLEPSYTHAGQVAARNAMTAQGTAAGTVAAVNGDFFDIGDTNAPRGVGLHDGELLNAPVSGWNNAAVFSRSGDVSGRLEQLELEAVATLPSGTTVDPTNLNSPRVTSGGIGIYTPEWGSVARSRTVQDASGAREVEIADGVVTAVRTSAGTAPVPAGRIVLLGREGGADALAGLQVGDRVEVTYGPKYGGMEAYAGITGNIVLVRDGQIDVPDHPRHPRTGVGFSADGRTMWLVALDGRSTASRGMTYQEFAEFMRSLGAHDALNLDGGGSTTMVAKRPGEIELDVLNQPSDGAQRPVPNGLGFTSTAFPAQCVRAGFDAQTYPALEEGATGGLVVAAQCLLKAAGFFDGTPGTTFDAGTADAVAAFQADRDLAATGSIDAGTWTALLSGGNRPLLQNGSSGLAVKRLQRALTAALGRSIGIDGLFGPETQTAVRDYQSSRGLGVDGIVGPMTWAALQTGR